MLVVDERASQKSYCNSVKIPEKIATFSVGYGHIDSSQPSKLERWRLRNFSTQEPVTTYYTALPACLLAFKTHLGLFCRCRIQDLM